MAGSSLFSFPDPVNDVAARTVAAGVIVMSVVAFAARQPWITALLAYGFVARVASGPRFSPLGQLATRVVAPRLSAHARFVPGPPKRFAQGIGALFTLSAFALWLGGYTFACYVLLAMLLVPAGLEAGFGLCVGCEIFAMLIRAHVLPESVCADCANLFGPGARARRKEALASMHGDSSAA